MRKNRRRGTHPLLRVVRRTAAILATALVLGLAAVSGERMLVWAKGHPYFAVREVEVEIKGKLDPKVVMAWAHLATGMSVWNVRPDEVEDRLLAHLRIRQARVERRLPSHVKIQVEERRPVAVVLARAPLFVAEDGTAFPPLPGESEAGLPYLSGLGSKDFGAGGTIETLRRAARLVALWQSHAEWPALSEVRAEGEDLMVFPARTPMLIRFGSEVDEERLARLGSVLDLWRGREAQVAAIDLSLPGQAVLRLRKPKGWNARKASI